MTLNNLGVIEFYSWDESILMGIWDFSKKSIQGNSYNPYFI